MRSVAEYRPIEGEKRDGIDATWLALQFPGATAAEVEREVEEGPKRRFGKAMSNNWAKRRKGDEP